MDERKNGPKKIIVDIDNTLWDLAPEFWERLKKINPHVPPPSEWGDREFWERYLSLREFFEVIKQIHLEQEKYAPFPESEFFLSRLREKGLYIIIASHRSQETFGPTVLWLEKNRLVYDELHLSYDKSVLFGQSWGLVDDSPSNLTKAMQAGILRTGLLCPWNEKSGHPLFKNLIEVLAYIDSELSICEP